MVSSLNSRFNTLLSGMGIATCGQRVARALRHYNRASHARQVKGDDPDKKGYPGPPGWEKTEGYCSTGQNPQWAVVPMEEKKNERLGGTCGVLFKSRVKNAKYKGSCLDKGRR
jgi:hypothetical protein